MKKLLTVLLAVFMVFSLVGCGETAEETTEGTATEEAKEQMLYYCAYLGDYGLYDLGHRACEAVCEKYDIELSVVEYGTDSSAAVNTYYDALEQKDYDYAVGLGWYISAEFETVAEMYPDTKFVYFDTSATSVYEHDNIYGISFAQNEGGFLTGVLGALMTTTGKTAIINGGDSAIFNDFGCGFIAGSKYAQQVLGIDFDWTHIYVSTNDMTGHTEAAETMIANGVDFLWPISAVNILAACGACENKGGAAAGYYVVGCDYDQWDYYNTQGSEDQDYQNLITSSLKNLEAALMLAFDSIKGNGTVQPGNTKYGIAEGGAGLAENEHYQELVPAEVQAQIAEISEKVANGEIKIPSYFDFSSDTAYYAYRDDKTSAWDAVN